MPINLPPEAQAAEKRYREAQTPAEKTATLEEWISTIPKHKGTDKLRAALRKRLSKLKDAAQTRQGSSRQESPYHIDKEGAGQVVLLGPANVGKSALVDALTNASPEVAAYPFSTWTPTPGMMPIENIQVQLIDTPPINQEFVELEMWGLVRRVDLALLLVDLQAFPIEQLEQTAAILAENRVLALHRQDQYPEQHRLVFKPLLVLANKCDDETLDEDFEVLKELLGDEWPLLPISALTGRHVQSFKQAVFEQLDIMRIYSKPPGCEADPNAPFVLEKGGTVEEFAPKVHKDFFERLKSARVWGGSVAFEGQMVSRDHVLQDGDVVELRI